MSQRTTTNRGCHSRRLRVRMGVVAALAALAAAPAALAAPGAYVDDSLASSYLGYSAWAHRNDVDVVACTGIGRARKSAVATQHASFRCRVRGATGAGVVVVTALGPQWLRVTRIASGTLKPDAGIGAVPKGKPAIDSDDANRLLEASAWARSNRVREVFCAGVGPYRANDLGDLFYAFSCATIDLFGQREGTVLVVAGGSSSVRVVRRLS